jgi:hypothetical protein
MEENEKSTLDVDRFILESYIILCENYSLVLAYIEGKYIDDENTKSYLQNMLERIDSLIDDIETIYKELIVSFNEYDKLSELVDEPIHYTLQGLFKWISFVSTTYRPDANASKDKLLGDLQSIISKVDRIQSVSKTVSDVIHDSEKGVYKYYENHALDNIEPDKLAYIVAKNISTSWSKYDDGISPYSSVCARSIDIMKLYQEMHPQKEW